MALTQLLSQSTIQDQICAHLTFEDARSLQQEIFPMVLKYSFVVQSRCGVKLLFSKITESTIQIYELLRKNRIVDCLLIALEKKNFETVYSLLNLIIVSNKLEISLGLFFKQDRDESLELIKLFLNQKALSKHQSNVLAILLNYFLISAIEQNNIVRLRYLYSISQEYQIPLNLTDSLVSVPFNPNYPCEPEEDDEQKSCDIIKFLVEKGANVNAVDCCNRTILGRVAFFPLPELTCYLLENGATSFKDKFGLTPLHIASVYGSVETVRALLNSGKIKVNEVDNQGKTAYSRTTNPEIRALLLEFGASP